MRVIVDRLKWNRGNFGPDQVYLFDSSAYPEQMDICGFIMSAAGMRFDWMDGVESPNDFLAMHPNYQGSMWRLATAWPQAYPTRTPFADLIIDINDDCGLTEWLREEMLQNECAEQDLCLVFIN